MPIRAYLESGFLSQFQGSLDYAYPGYTEAVPPNVPEGNDIRARSRRFVATDQVRSPFYGNDQFRIMSIDQSNRDVTTLVCFYNYTVAKLDDDGSYYSVAQIQSREPRGIWAMRIYLKAPESLHELAPQEGPSPAPGEDVFGGWQITGMLDVYVKNLPGFAEAWPTYDTDLASCVDAAPDSPERRAFLSSGQHPRDDFPTSPPFPGWPDAPSQ